MSEDADTAAASALLKPLHTESERSEVVQQLYSPLQPWETRLLALQPGKFYEPLVASLGTAVITYEEGLGLVQERRNVTYEALSYTWGGEILSHPLVCNGYMIGITQNLSTALHYLRQSAGIRYLWVDAICINQSHNEEKARQIRNLQTIFRKAASVVAWLGEERKYTKLAIRALELYDSEQDCFPVEETSKWSSMWDESGPLETKIFEGLLDLAQRPWLSRAWVVQEVFVSKSLSVHCGRHNIIWDSFSRLGDCLQLVCKFGREANFEIQLKDNAIEHSLVESTTKPIKFLVSMTNTSTHFHMGPAQEFYELLRETAHLKATDPRDRIWALVGLTKVPVFYGAHKSDSETENGIHIDYGKSKAQVYAEVTKYFLSSLEKGYKLLCPHPRQNDLPSWCFDFLNAQVPHVSPLGLEEEMMQEHRSLYSKDMLNEADARATGRQNDSWRTLTVTGWHLGTICALRYVNLGAVPISEDTGWQNDLQSSSVLHKSYRKPFAFVDVLHSTCLKDWIWDYAGKGVVVRVGARSGNAGQSRRPTLNMGKRIRERLFQLLNDRKDTPTDGIEEYMDGKHGWRVSGHPRPKDIIVYSYIGEGAIVLRRMPDSTFIYIGDAIPVKYLKFQLNVRLSRSYRYWPGEYFPVPRAAFQKDYDKRIKEHPGLHESEETFNIC